MEFFLLLVFVVSITLLRLICRTISYYLSRRKTNHLLLEFLVSILSIDFVDRSLSLLFTLKMQTSKSNIEQSKSKIIHDEVKEEDTKNGEQSKDTLVVNDHKRSRSAGGLHSAWSGVTSFASYLVGSKSRDSSSAPEKRQIKRDIVNSESQSKGILQGVVSGVLNFLVPQNESMDDIEKKLAKNAVIDENNEKIQTDSKENEEKAENKPGVHIENRRKWEELRNTDWWDPSEGRSLTALERVEHASMFIEDTISGDESIERASWMRKIHRFRKSTYWSRFVWLIILAHLVLAWFEPESIRNLANVPLLTIRILQWVELFFIVVEWVDMILNYLQMGPGYFWSNRYEIFTLVVNALILTDLLLAMTLSSMIMLRWSRPIRPFMMFSRTKVLRSSLNAMFATLKALSNLALYLIAMVLLYAIIGINLFWGIYQQSGAELMIEGNFDNSYKGLVSMFVLMTTANYPFVMYPSFTVLGPWSLIFFVSFLLLAFYLTLTVLIAAVFANYKDARLKNVVAERARERRGLAAAFQYLDFDDSQDITRDIFEALLFTLYPKMESWKVDLLFDICDLNGDGRLDVLEFFDLSDALYISMEELNTREQIFDTKSHDNNGPENKCLRITWKIGECCKGCGVCLGKIGNSKWMHGISTFMVVLYVCVMCTFNLLPIYAVLPVYYISFALCLLMLGEVISSVVFSGVSEFWKNPWSRFDLIITCIASAAHLLLISLGPSYISMVGAAGGQTIPLDQQWLSRLLSALSASVSIRLLSRIERFREMLSTLMGIIPTMINVFITIAAFLYFFASIGMWLFAGDFSGLTLAEYSNPHANFDTITAALITLFQVLTLANWHLTMYAAVIEKGWWAVLYFIPFVSVVVIIFLNLIMALVIELFLSHSGVKKKENGTVIEIGESVNCGEGRESPCNAIDTELSKLNEGAGTETHINTESPTLHDTGTPIKERHDTDSISVSVPLTSTGETPLLETAITPHKRIRRILLNKHRKPWERDFPDVDSMFQEELVTLSALMRIPCLSESKRVKDDLRWERRHALESESAPVAHRLQSLVREVVVDPCITQHHEKSADAMTKTVTSKFDMDLFKATSMKVSGARTYKQKKSGSAIQLITRETRLRSDSTKTGATRLFKRRMNALKKHSDSKV